MRTLTCRRCSRSCFLVDTRFVKADVVECVRCHAQNVRLCPTCSANLYNDQGEHCECYECVDLFWESSHCHACNAACGHGLCVECKVKTIHAVDLATFLAERYPILEENVVRELTTSVKREEVVTGCHPPNWLACPPAPRGYHKLPTSSSRRSCKSSIL